MAVNVLLICGGLLVRGMGITSDDYAAIPVSERFVARSKDARDKVAVVRIEGTIMEGLLGFAHKQIERAAEDSHVKAVVARIESPGGTITASEELHRRLVQLRDGTTPKFQGDTPPPAAKPIVV